jgi:hypothetical protein
VKVTYEMTALACQRCLKLAKEGKIRSETVQPVPKGAVAPLGLDGKKCCFDCQAADTVVRLHMAPGWEAARIATGNDRQEQYRFPGAPLGLVGAGLLRPSEKGDFERHLKWLDANDWFGLNPAEDT